MSNHHHGPTFEEREHQQCHIEEAEERRHFMEILLLLPLLTPRQVAILADLTHMLTCPLETLAYFVISPKGGTMTPTQQPLPILVAGSTTQLVATGYDKQGNVDAVPAGNSLAWGVSDSTLASIDSTGKLTLATDAPAGKTFSVTVGLATPLGDGSTPTGAADQPIGAGEIASFIIAPAPVAPPAAPATS